MYCLQPFVVRLESMRMGLSFRYFQKALSMYTKRCVIHLVLILTKLGEAEGVQNWSTCL